MGIYNCPSCKKGASKKITCKYCGIIFCSHTNCKGSTGNVKGQSAKTTNSQCKACGKTLALVMENA
jgi:hypothetical protein